MPAQASRSQPPPPRTPPKTPSTDPASHRRPAKPEPDGGSRRGPARGRFARLLSPEKTEIAPQMPRTALPADGPGGPFDPAAIRIPAEPRALGGSPSEDSPLPEPVQRDARADREGPLGAFSPPPAVLTPLVGSGAPPPAPAAGSGAAHAEAAALAERLVTSLRVGRSQDGRHEVRMRLATSSRGGIEVQLRHDRDRLEAVLHADAGSRPDADRLAELVQTELAGRGVELDTLEVRMD